MRSLLLVLLLFPLVVNADNFEKTSYNEFDIPLPKWGRVLEVSPIIENKEGFSIINLGVINEINNQCNNIKYKSDRVNYNQVDYWASPEEFLNNGGDCEDYAICKYYKLREKGVDTKNLAIIMGYNKQLNDFHAVLSVTYNNKKYILDNNIKALIDQDFYYTKIFIPYYKANELNVTFN